MCQQTAASRKRVLQTYPDELLTVPSMHEVLLRCFNLPDHFFDEELDKLLARCAGRPSNFIDCIFKPFVQQTMSARRGFSLPDLKQDIQFAIKQRVDEYVHSLMKDSYASASRTDAGRETSGRTGLLPRLVQAALLSNGILYRGSGDDLLFDLLATGICFFQRKHHDGINPTQCRPYEIDLKQEPLILEAMHTAIALTAWGDCPGALAPGFVRVLSTSSEVDVVEPVVASYFGCEPYHALVNSEVVSLGAIFAKLITDRVGTYPQLGAFAMKAHRFRNCATLVFKDGNINSHSPLCMLANVDAQQLLTPETVATGLNAATAGPSVEDLRRRPDLPNECV